MAFSDLNKKLTQITMDYNIKNANLFLFFSLDTAGSF